MRQYLDIIEEVLKDGIERVNRTNQEDIFIPSATIKVDLRDGFPALTTKQLFYKQSVGEILGFIRGYDNAADFRALGCNIWNSDANENETWLSSPYRKGEDDLGKIYGSTWRKREVFKKVKYWDGSGVGLQEAQQEQHLQRNGYTCQNPPKGNDSKPDNLIYSKKVDQLHDVVDTIINNPNNRRIVLHAWFPELFDEMALPPCHVMYRFIPDEKNRVLHMTMFQRSCDLLLGVPFNLFGSSLLLALIAKATGYTAGTFTHQMADVHLYDNALDQASIQVRREPMMLPMLRIHKEGGECNNTNDAIKWLEGLEPHNIELAHYKYHEKLERVQMAQEKYIWMGPKEVYLSTSEN